MLTFVLRLQVPVERRDERAVDVVRLEAHQGASIWHSVSARVFMTDRHLQGSEIGGRRLPLPWETAMLCWRSVASDASIAKSKRTPPNIPGFTTLSLIARGGEVLLSLSAGTRPLGETSRSSAGFLYGSTSSIVMDDKVSWIPVGGRYSKTYSTIRLSDPRC